MQPATVGPYTVLRTVGAGRTGRVLLARTDRGARLAVRVFRPELAAYPRFRAGLRAEVDAAARADGARVVVPVDADTAGERVWVATPYVDAPALHTVVAERGPLGPADARRLGAGLAEALTALHAVGVVHGDLTPGEVLLGPDGPHSTDAGLARAAAATPLTRYGALVGTLGYLAPEQVEDGVAVAASDVFALGAVLLFAATWRRPFGDGDATAVLHRVLHGAPDLGGLSGDLADVVAACLDRDPGRRPAPEQVRAALAEGGRPPAPGAPEEPDWPTVVRHRLPAPYRGPSPARRAAATLGVTTALVGLLAVVTADAVGSPPPAPITAAVTEALRR